GALTSGLHRHTALFPARKTHVSFLILLRPPPSPLFPYTTLFRSQRRELHASGQADFDKSVPFPRRCALRKGPCRTREAHPREGRSEEHTSELQSLAYLVCRLLLEKKKQPVTIRASYGRCGGASGF